MKSELDITINWILAVVFDWLFFSRPSCNSIDVIAENIHLPKFEIGERDW